MPGEEPACSPASFPGFTRATSVGASNKRAARVPARKLDGLPR